MKEQDTVKCLKCHEYRAAIRKHNLICEFGRHRFTPWSKKQLEAMARDEAEYIK